MRARYPDFSGYVDRDGVKVAYDVYGEGDQTLLLVASSPTTHSESWKGQVHYLSRHHRVVTIDGRGNGRSDRPQDPSQYSHAAAVGDLLAVLDAVDAPTAVLVAHCHASYWAFLMAAANPERVSGIVTIAPGIPFLGVPNPNLVDATEHFDDEEPGDPQGFRMYNRVFWQRGGFESFYRFWFNHLAAEPHSTKQVEDMVSWALDTDHETMSRAFGVGGHELSRESSEELCRAVKCPVLVIHGTEDRCQLPPRGQEVAALTGGQLMMLEGTGHLAPGRHPAVVNRLISDFVEELGGAPMKSRTWVRGAQRPQRALYVSSPIGLGHARRDVAIAGELRKLRPELEIEWLAQSPVTTVLEAEGHSIHSASRWLANESAHFASEAAGHDLNAFQAIRNMDEILVANFMVFQEVVEEGHYDLVLADEAWDIDHFWHENPELKRGSHVWMTDFVGFLPMPEGGEREALLTADYNAEMVEHIARYPRLRDRSVFVGNSDDIVDDLLGPDLPRIRDWTEQHFHFSGYITGFVPPTADEAAELRRELGWGEEKVCMVTVGGSGVGQALLERVIEAYPYARKEVNDLRMVVVTGPRISPEFMAIPEGVEVVGYVDRLHRHLSVCDLAVVQGGLTTTMELAAARRPFLYFPLRNHFEQNRHVRHRLERYRAGRFMDYASSGPEDIAEAMTQELNRTLDYRPVETDGAARAASLIAELI